MSQKAIAGWKKAVVYNPANGDRVQLNRISTQFSELPDDRIIRTETATGSVYGGKSFPVTLGFIDSDGLALMEIWQLENRPLNLVIFSPAGHHILFRESETITMNPGTAVNARDGAVVHRLEIEHISGLPDIFELKNLAKAVDFDDEAGDIVFPLAGPTLTLAADYDDPDGATMVIEAKDFSGTVLADSSESAAQGRVSTSITLPPDTYSLDIDLLDGGTGTVTDISLRSDGKSEYINF